MVPPPPEKAVRHWCREGARSASGNDRHGGPPAAPPDATRPRADGPVRRPDGPVADPGRPSSTEPPAAAPPRTDANLAATRDAAFPRGPDEEEDPPTRDGRDDPTGRVLPAREDRSPASAVPCDGRALGGRFEGLPVHEACYQQSRRPREAALRGLREALAGAWMDDREAEALDWRSPGEGPRDRRGLAPLHVLCRSTVHRIEMYELLLERYPEDLLAEDEWGDVPLLYAIWGRAPRDVVELLAASMRSHGPGHLVDWAKMVRTLSEAAAPAACVGYLIETAREEFPEQLPHLRAIGWGRMLGVLCAEGGASEELALQFVRTYRASLPENEAVGLEDGYFRLVLSKKLGFRPFWLGVPVSERLAALPREDWRGALGGMMGGCPTGSSERAVHQRIVLTNALFDKLDLYENLERLLPVELALWRMRIAESDGERRAQCRVTSGADVVARNVLPYLRRVHGFGRELLGECTTVRGQRHG